MKNLVTKTKKHLKTAKNVTKWSLVGYVVVSVVFTTLTVTGQKEVLPFTEAEASYGELGDVTYEEWREAQAEALMEKDSWREHMLSEAKATVDMATREASRTRFERDAEAFNLEHYGQKETPNPNQRE